MTDILAGRMRPWHRAVFIAALLLLAPAALVAQEPAPRTAQQISDSLEIADLARALTARVPSDSARAAVLYEWVARHIAYDVAGYLSGRMEDGGAESVYRLRTAVCGGFVALYQRLAQEAGLAAMPVIGYAKGVSHVAGQPTKKPNHAWLAVAVNGRWRLLDPTWGAGVIVAGRFEPRFTWDWFMVDPSALVLSHFPEGRQWQLLARPVKRTEFERLPSVPTTLLRIGFDAEQIRISALSAGIRDFPLVGARRDARIVNAPLSGVLPRASTVAIEIVWAGGNEVALVSGGVWTKLTRDGDRFSGQAVASAETISLVGRASAAAPYETLLYYRVQ